MCSLILVIGGAASGKSALGERICQGRGGRLLYLATMRPHGEEAMARIRRHHELRAGKGFGTLERYRDLESAAITGRYDYDAVLLECLGNLAANEMFDAGIPEDKLPAKIMAGIEHVMRFTGTLVVVTNDIFAGVERYEGGTAAYLRSLAGINRELAARAELVIESVAGLPFIIKSSPVKGGGRNK